ncbi:MAG: hypothetical protein IKH75_13785, partial [Ruminococcus sp.]|nr:hypothetical protein [Ruminococcus sp.]
LNFLACPDSEILRQKVLKCDSIPAAFFLAFLCQSVAIFLQELIGGAIAETARFPFDKCSIRNSRQPFLH